MTTKLAPKGSKAAASAEWPSAIVGKPLDIAVGAQYTDIDVCLGHVDTYRH